MSYVSDYGRHGSGTGAETAEGESGPRILVPALEGRRNVICCHWTIVSGNVQHSSGGPSQEGMKQQSMVGTQSGLAGYHL